MLFPATLRTFATPLLAGLLLATACADDVVHLDNTALDTSYPDADVDAADSSPDTTDATAELDAAPDAAPDAVPDTAPEPRLCQGPLFGRPAANTGLDDTMCSPQCTCNGEVFDEPDYTEGDLEALRSLVLNDPYEVPAEDPYTSDVDPVLDDTTVCAILFDDATTYRLETFISEAAALAAGATITHQSACGVCSTLHDLSIYIGVPDLTTPVRECGLQGIREGEERNIECLLELGFTPPCAQIWFYNTRNTRTECAEPCFALLGQPYHNPDGSLNECLRCDEEISGPVFKAYAGRTRRNSGIATALCRPCAEVRPIVHRY